MLGPLEALIRLHELSVGDSMEIDEDRAGIERERCVSELPRDIVDRYEFLLERYGHSAIAPVKGDCCMGCFVHVPTSRVNQIEEGLYLCEHCGRLLYDESKVYDLIHV